ncbi:MAG: hypothetical protein EOP14_04125 [Pseudomonas sp.]|nr:MAG: hypothetical protein EOP14_04125 [Pseudomonas sp.]
MDDKMDEATEIFSSFSVQMKCWNDKFYLPMKESAVAVSKQAVAELAPIFGQYVWPDAVRSEERLNNPSTSQPSDYDPDIDTIENREISKSKILLHVQKNTGFRNKFRYTIVKRKNEWKLLRRDVFNDLSGKWKSHHI